MGTITADRLNDYITGRVQGRERARIRQGLAADPALRGALRRLRRTAHALHALGGEAGADLPREWLRLLDAAPRPAPMRPADLARERKLTWL